MASANPDPVEAIAMTDMAFKDLPENYDTERALIAKEVDTEEENKTHEKGKANEII